MSVFHKSLGTLLYLSLFTLLTSCAYEKAILSPDAYSPYEDWFDGTHSSRDLVCYGEIDRTGVSCIIATFSTSRHMLKIQDLEGAPYRYVICYRAKDGAYRSVHSGSVGSHNPTFEILDHPMRLEGRLNHCSDVFHIPFPEDMATFISASVEACVMSFRGVQRDDCACRVDECKTYHLPVNCRAHRLGCKQKIQTSQQGHVEKENVGDVAFGDVLGRYLMVVVAGVGAGKRAYIHGENDWRCRVSYLSDHGQKRICWVGDEFNYRNRRMFVFNPWSPERRFEPVIACDVFHHLNFQLPKDFRKMLDASIELVSVDWTDIAKCQTINEWNKMRSERRSCLPVSFEPPSPRGFDNESRSAID